MTEHRPCPQSSGTSQQAGTRAHARTGCTPGTDTWEVAGAVLPGGRQLDGTASVPPPTPISNHLGGRILEVWAPPGAHDAPLVASAGGCAGERPSPEAVATQL